MSGCIAARSRNRCLQAGPQNLRGRQPPLVKTWPHWRHVLVKIFMCYPKKLFDVSWSIVDGCIPCYAWGGEELRQQNRLLLHLCFSALVGTVCAIGFYQGIGARRVTVLVAAIEVERQGAVV